jgi:carboxypeptidase Taq
MTTHAELRRRFARLAAIGDALGILQWDTETMMPAGSAGGREEQLATLKVLRHELLTDPATADLLEQAERAAAASNDADPWEAANLREMRRAWRHAAAVPADLVEANSRAVLRAEIVWRGARPANDFKALLPALAEVLDRQRELATLKAHTLAGPPMMRSSTRMIPTAARRRSTPYSTTLQPFCRTCFPVCSNARPRPPLPSGRAARFRSGPREHWPFN